MADFDVTAVLEHIRDGAESEITHPDDECGIEAGGFCTPHGALRLLAAVEAVLKAADDWDAKSAEIWAQIQIQDCDAASAGFKAIGATRYKEDAKAVREAIRAALAGEEAGDAKAE